MNNASRALQTAKQFANLKHQHWEMTFVPKMDEKFWRYFAQSKSLTFYTANEVVIACLLFYWMERGEKR